MNEIIYSFYATCKRQFEFSLRVASDKAYNVLELKNNCKVNFHNFSSDH